MNPTDVANSRNIAPPALQQQLPSGAGKLFFWPELQNVKGCVLKNLTKQLRGYVVPKPPAWPSFWPSVLRRSKGGSGHTPAQDSSDITAKGCERRELPSVAVGNTYTLRSTQVGEG